MPTRLIDLVLNGFQTVLQRILVAWTTLPTLQDWLFAALLLGIYAAISLPIGHKTGFLQAQRLLPWSQTSIVLLASLLSPAISEELVYRVMFLPHSAESPSSEMFWLWNLLSLAIFIISHPINAYTFFRAARGTFLQPAFLSMAGLLGIICAIAYQQSGSLWTAVFIHWVIVVIWLLILGGYQKLYAK